MKPTILQLAINYKVYAIAEKVIRNEEKPQKFITSGVYYLVTRTGFEPMSCALICFVFKSAARKSAMFDLKK